MWNRVALLTAGMALGWSLVTWLSGTEEASGRARFHVGLATLAGAALILWLGIENVATAVVATFVFGVGAMVAYAARAKQFLRPPEPAPLSPTTNTDLASDERLAVLLSPGPPPRYSPAAIARLQTRGVLPSGFAQCWLQAPVAYRRLRRAYRERGPLPLSIAQENARMQLQERLGSAWHVESAYLGDEQTLAVRLLRWRRRGYREAIVLPVDLDASDQAEIASQLRESVAAPFVAHVAPVTQIIARNVYEDTIRALYSDTEPPACSPPTPQAIDELATLATAARD